MIVKIDRRSNKVLHKDQIRDLKQTIKEMRMLDETTKEQIINAIDYYLKDISIDYEVIE